MSSVTKTIIVEGVPVFPIRMLWQDAAYPKTPEDASHIEASVQRVTQGVVRVSLITSKKWSPTASLWESFGWKVVKVS